MDRKYVSIYLYMYVNDILIIADNSELILNQINDLFLLKKGSVGELKHIWAQVLDKKNSRKYGIMKSRINFCCWGINLFILAISFIHTRVARTIFVLS